MRQFIQFKEYLKSSTFLTDEDCSFFFHSLVIKQIKAKENFSVANKICKEIGFINSGCFRMYYLDDGKEINTNFSFENQFVVDYDSFLSQKISKYHIQALEDSEIVIFNLQTLERAYNLSKNWERFGRLIAEYSYQQTTSRVESFLFLEGEQRYLELLQNSPKIFERIPLYHIASYLGLERESLSRLRKKIATK